MKPVKRYRTPELSDADYGLVNHVGDPEGDWVSYDDYANLLASQGWIPIEERHPPTTGYDCASDLVLVYVERDFGYKIFTATCDYGDGDGVTWCIEGEPDRTSPYKIGRVTHWMPLPEKPESRRDQ